MNKTEIYIEGELLDLSQGTVVASTFQLSDIRDLKSRFANYTNRFLIPKTARNNDILGHISNENSASRKAYTKLPAKIIQNGIEIIPNGTALVTNTDLYYNLSIFSGIFDFFEGLGTATLNDLTFTNEGWEPADQDAVRAATSGLVAPVMDYGKFFGDQSPHNINFLFNYPSVYYSTVFDKILTAAGYTKAGTVFSGDEYTKLIIPFSQPNFEYADSFKIRHAFSASAAGGQVINLNNSSFQILFADISFNGSGYYISDYNYKPSTSIDYWYRFILNTIVNMDVTVSSGSAKIQLFSAANIWAEETIVTGSGQTVRLISDAISYLGSAVGNRDHYVRVTCTGVATVTINSGVYFNEVLPTINRQRISVADIMPTVSQKEFIKHFGIRFGTLVKQDNKVLTFKKIKDIINDRANAVDWTSKRVASIPDNIVYYNSSYAQENVFKFANTEFEGKGSLIIDNEHLKATESYYDDIFNYNVTTRAGLIKCLNVPAVDPALFNELSEPQFASITTVTVSDFNAETNDKIEGKKLVASAINSGLRGQNLLDEFFYYGTPARIVFHYYDESDGNSQFHVYMGFVNDNAAFTASRSNLLINFRFDLTGIEFFRGTTSLSSIVMTPDRTTQYSLFCIGNRVYYEYSTDYGVTWQGTQYVGDNYTVIPASKDYSYGICIALSGIPCLFKGLSRWTDADAVELTDNGVNLAYVRDKFDHEPGVFYDEDERTDYLVAFSEEGSSDLGISWEKAIEDNYTELQSALDSTKLITRYYRLNEVDIVGLDFFKLVHNNGHYYILNKVDNFIPGQSTKCEIFKVS